jgi:hypothetical protein
MANNTISALSSATTPLTGNEIVPLNQSGVTNSVSVANLTSSRAVSALSFSAATIGATANTTLSIQANGTTYATILGAGTNNGFIGIGTNSPSAALEVSNASAGNIRITTVSGTSQLQFKSSGTNLQYINYNFGGAGALSFYDSNSTAERSRIDSSGNFLIGTTSTAGSSSNTASVVGGLFSTASGTAASIASGTATTIFTVPSGKTNWVYIVSADVSSGAPTGYSCVYLVTSDAGVLRATALQSATLNIISVSGTNIQVTQNSGAAASVLWTVTRVS